ncbi:Uncharacterised protein [Mycobacteroides abscessus]|nr:Uncharacterised protein [Mycobacteroides abscessus]
MKSRLPCVSAYDSTEKSRPNPAPIPTAVSTNPPWPENMKSSRPTKRPNHAPDAAPAIATRP